MRRSLTFLVGVLLGSLTACGGPSHHSQGHKVGTAAPIVAATGDQVATGSVHPSGWGLPPKNSTLRPTALPPTATPTAEMFDTVTLSTVPRGAPWLAGYTAGFWPTFRPLVALPWHPHVVSIAISVRYHARCLDIEPGDADPSSAASWYFAVRSDPAMRSSLVDGKPCEYSSFWEYKNQVIPVLSAHGIARSAIWEWDADYTFVRHIDAGFDCTQWTNKARGLNLDESTCTLAFLGVHPKPPPPPSPPGYKTYFNAGFQRGFILRWDELHHRRVPALRSPLRHTSVWQYGFRIGWRDA